jgi:hypothetical protein
MSGGRPTGSAIVTPGPFNQQGMVRREAFVEADLGLTATSYRFLAGMFNEIGRLQGLGPPPLAALEARLAALQDQVTTLSGEVITLRARLP